MSQKRKTTGLPIPERSARKYKSRSERDAQANRLIIMVTGIIAAIIIVILAIALLIDNVINPNKVIASVNGQNITVTSFQKHAAYQRWQYGQLLQQVPQQYQQQIFTSNQQGSPYQQYADAYSQMSEPVLLGKTVLDDMKNQALIEQYAKANNITVDQSDLDKQLDTFFNYQPTAQTNTPTATTSATPTPLLTLTPSQTPTITPTLAQSLTPTLTPFPTGAPTATPGPTDQAKNFATNQKTYFDKTLAATGLSESDIRALFAESALRKKVLDTVTKDVAPGNKEEQLKVRHILIDINNTNGEAVAKSIMTSLQNGESFAALAKADSTDTGSGASGGELGWKGKGAYVKEFEAAIWAKDTKVGDILGPIKSQFGWHIIQVEGHQTRQITDRDKDNSKNLQFTAFVDDMKTKADIKDVNDYSAYVPTSPSLADFNIQAGLTSQNSGIPGQ